MVTVLPQEETTGQILGKALGQIGASAAQSHLDRADEMALQKTVLNLPQGSSMRDTLNAVLNTPTYTNKQKQEYLKNVMGIEEFEQARNKANAEIELKKADQINKTNANAIKSQTLEETTRHHKALEANAAGKTTTAKEIAEGKYKSAERIATEKRLADAEKLEQQLKFNRENLDFERQAAKDKLDLAKEKLANDIVAMEKKLELAAAAEKRKDTQGAEKLKQDAADLKRKIDEQATKVDQFDRQFEMKNDHFNRNLQFNELKNQQLLDLKAEESNLKLQEFQAKVEQEEADLEEKKRQFDLNYELSLNKDLREQDKAQADLDKIKHQIEHDQNNLNATIKYRDEQQAIAREQNDIAWKKLEQTNPSEFEKVRQKLAAEEYAELEKKLPELYNTQQDIKDTAELAAKLGWGAPIKSLFGAESPALLEAKSYKLLEPIIHVFNPSGVLGFKKLDQLRAQYQIKANDAPGTRKAKAEALALFNDQAIKIAEDRMKLIRQYNGAPPLNVMEQSKKDAESLVDAMLDYDQDNEGVKIPGLPKAEPKNAGRTITDTKTGLKYISDGVRWTQKK